MPGLLMMLQYAAAYIGGAQSVLNRCQGSYVSVYQQDRGRGIDSMEYILDGS
jgi:hypothetical protein